MLSVLRPFQTTLKTLTLLVIIGSNGATAGELVLTFSIGSEKLELLPGDIVEVGELNVSSTSNSFHIGMSDVKAREFGVLTEQYVGQQMDITICGKLLFTPTIREPIHGGVVMLSSIGDPLLVEVYEKNIKRREC